MVKINKINQFYKTDAGEKMAEEEMVSVMNRYIAKNPKILEMGVGYGRNLKAMSKIEGSNIVGCDIFQSELDKASELITKHSIKNVKLLLQTEENKFPVEDNEFDAVVSWQVLEHVGSKRIQQALIVESTRVLKDGGMLLIETPNKLFPFDYHDNNLPFLHWFGLDKLRYKLTRFIRDEDFEPSQYTHIYKIRKYLKRSPYIKSFEQKTKIYFEESYLNIFKHMGGTRLVYKKIFFLLYWPFYVLFRIFGISGDILTPSIRVVFKVNK